jgi:predicted amidohydrolase YtcJ
MEWGFDHWRRRIGAGALSLRVDVGIYTANLQRVIDQGLRTGMTIPGTEELLRVGPYKVITDGALNTRTAWCVDEYPGLHGRPDSHGLLTVSPEDLLGHLRTALEAGLRPAVHAIGDQANHLALNAFEQLQSFRGTTGTGRKASMGSIEHAQLLTRTDMNRFADLGVVASVQPEHAMDDRDVADRYWAGRTDRAFALNSLLNAGAELALGSDAPVAPLDPWFSLAAAVGRSRDDREAWHPAESITARQALTASARGRSELRLNEIADIAVCDEDPYAASVSKLRHMPVSATMIAGRFTHNKL